MTVAPNGADVRRRLIDDVRRDLLGPETVDELLPQSPATRYLVGMLAPAGTPIEETEDENDDVAEAEESDSGPNLARTLTPSSIGISFVVSDKPQNVEASFSWGEYQPERASDQQGRRASWRRFANQVTVRIDPSEPDREIDFGDGVSCRWISRRLGSTTVVSAFLVNRREAPKDRRPPDEFWLYQPRVRVTSDAGFLPRRSDRAAPDPDPDISSGDLVYRKRLEYATGHNSAASWEEQSQGSSLATAVWTEIIPEREVLLAKPSGDTPAVLSMERLAGATSAAGLRDMLTPLADGYASWIEDLDRRVADVEAALRPVARDHVGLARESLARVRGGIQLLEHRPDVFEAFQFASRALALQRRTVERVRAIRRSETNDPQPPSWRPFQMAFILQCLAGLSDPSSDERGIADLLWFPTGGGKTEAYLGLTALAFALRRLRRQRDDSGAGVTVLMRYTLRLLTIQQFQRATALICACETLRRADPAKWGDEAFTIGLWVGGAVTPNSYTDSRDALAKLRGGARLREGSPYQLLYCPWCGTDISVNDYLPDDDLERTLIKCPNGDCAFNSTSDFGLPVLLVDEEIYRNPPSLLLSTVDKFAQVAWNGRVQSLFGSVERRCVRHGYLTTAEGTHAARHQATKSYPAVTVRACTRLDPPDLVIQDELHLISGPLGTLTGIYESVIDDLASRAGIRPKLVASTATIRRAAQQIRALFDRRVAVFPPQGLDAADSYFAVEDRGRPGRLYVGVYAPGKSIKTALVRVYAAMLARAQAEFDATPSPVTDAYMTLVGYFNSLRELGGAVRLVDDDVPARIRVLQRRGFGPSRIIYQKGELTSRARSTDIAETLKTLDRTFIGARRAGAYPVDVLLASSMLSVGVDIDRLGLMVVSAQPKTSAEYIQATSRVGRVHPGIVLEVYNWIRPRDTSHYERFMHYHDTLYRHVEATSVTPFSARARDRALRGIVTGAIRQGVPALAPESGADGIDQSQPYSSRLADYLGERGYRVTEREDVRDTLRTQVANLLDEWERYTQRRSGRSLVYSGRGSPGDTKNVLLRPMEQKTGRGIWRVPTSLREVEAEIPVVIEVDPTT